MIVVVVSSTVGRFYLGCVAIDGLFTIGVVHREGSRTKGGRYGCGIAATNPDGMAMQGVYVSSQWQPLVVLVCRCRSSLAASQPQEELNGLFTDQGQEIDPVAIVGGGRDKGEGF